MRVSHARTVQLTRQSYVVQLTRVQSHYMAFVRRGGESISQSQVHTQNLNGEVE